MKNLTFSLYSSSNTVFTAREISILLGETNLDLVKARINYAVKKKILISPRKGIYVKDKQYDRFEMACKILTPSYVSLETILQKEGVVFQDYQSIFVISYQSREITVDGQKYIYKKIKNRVLINHKGLEIRGNCLTATKERAFLDALYLYKNYHFDNISNINFEICREILPVYESNTLKSRYESYV